MDDQLDKKLTEFCKREGYTKGGLVAKLIRFLLDQQQQKGSPDPMKEAQDFGIDLTLLQSSLQKSPTERLRDHAQFHAFTEQLRRAGARKKHDPL